MKELPLPFVNNLKHLGNILQSDNKIFISKIHSLNQEFYYNNSDIILKLYNIYCCSFYGFSFWDLSAQYVSKLYTAWNTTRRILFNVLVIRITMFTCKTYVSRRCVYLSMRLLKQVLSFALDFFPSYAKMTWTQF